MALIQCIECKKEISDTRDECIHCGMKIKSPPNLNYVTCSECGRKIDNSKDECMHCGMRIKDFSRDESIKYRDNWIDPRVLIKNSENKYEKDGEIILINSHIAAFKQASYSNHNPTDERKLLLNKKEINKLIGKMQRDGFTLVPTKMYFKKGKAKIEIAVAKGKKQFDKRATKKNRDWNREKARHIRKSS